MTRSSWIGQNVAAVAEMVSYCPSFWDICGIEYSSVAIDYPAAQKEALRHTKQSNLMTWCAEADSANPDLSVDEKLIPRKRKNRQDWIDARPLATVMHDTDNFTIKTLGTNYYAGSGIITVFVEKNVFDNNGVLLGVGDMPSEYAANEWLDQMGNLMEELHQITNTRCVPLSNVSYPGKAIAILQTDFSVPPQFSTLDTNRIYGSHFCGAVKIMYGAKN